MDQTEIAWNQEKVRISIQEMRGNQSGKGGAKPSIANLSAVFWQAGVSVMPY